MMTTPEDLERLVDPVGSEMEEVEIYKSIKQIKGNYFLCIYFEDAYFLKL
jgi:hypothetical protein